MVEAIAVGVSFIAGAGAVLSLAFRALSAERRAGKAETKAAALDANHSHVSIRLAETAELLKDAQERIDELANELAKLAAAAPTTGSYWRLLLALNARKAPNGGDDKDSLLNPFAPEPGSDTDLPGSSSRR